MVLWPNYDEKEANNLWKILYSDLNSFKFKKYFLSSLIKHLYKQVALIIEGPN